MDRINSSSFPINQALRAYAQSPKLNRPGGSPFAQSVQPMRPVAPSTDVQAPASLQATPLEPTRRSDQLDTVGKITPKKSALNASSISELVGAKVQAIDLTRDVAKVIGPKPVTTSAGTYTMYPQASDRNLAATNVAIGRSLDLRG